MLEQEDDPSSRTHDIRSSGKNRSRIKLEEGGIMNIEQDTSHNRSGEDNSSIILAESKQ